MSHWGCPGRPPWVPRVCPKCLPMTTSQLQTFRKHVAHVQHSHEVVDITVDALGHTRVLQGDRRGVPGAQSKALAWSPLLPRPAAPQPCPTHPHTLGKSQLRPSDAAETPGPSQSGSPLSPTPAPETLPTQGPVPPAQSQSRQSLSPVPTPPKPSLLQGRLTSHSHSRGIYFSVPHAAQALGPEMTWALVLPSTAPIGTSTHTRHPPGSSWPPHGHPSCGPGAPARWRQLQRAAPQSTPACPASWGPGHC